MNVIKTAIDGVLIIEPRLFQDNRGYFYESYNAKTYKENGISADFIQDNESKSSYGVIRGLHAQSGEFSQAKLVRVLKGKVLDVAVDIRKGSPTFGQHVAVELSEDNKRQFFIPRGFLHGFSVLSETAIFAYKCDNFYNKASEISARFDDPDLNIDWKIDINKAQTSEKDLNAPSFKELTNTL